MRDLGLARADRDQALAGEHREHLGDPLVAVCLQFGQRHPPAYDRVAVALGQAQQDPARELAPRRVEPRVGALGQPRDRAADAARVLVGAHAQVAAVAVLPELEQRRREQRQTARLALDVGDQRVRELGLDPQPGYLRGQLDRAPQLGAAHRADQHVAGTQQPRQLGIGRAAPVEVGAHGQQHERAAARIARGGHERVHERGALALVTTRRERLLELIDRHDHAAGARGGGRRTVERGQRVLAGSQQRQRPALAPGQHAGGQRGQQPGPQRGRLAAAGWPDDAHQRRARQARHHLGDQLLAAEEHACVLDVERGEALERARDHCPTRHRSRCGGGPPAAPRRCRPARPLPRAGRCARSPRGRPPRRAVLPPRRAPTPRQRGGRERALHRSPRAAARPARPRPHEARRRAAPRRARPRRRAAPDCASRRRRGGREHLVLGRRQQQQRPFGRACDDLLDRRAHVLARAVHVVEHDQRRPPRRVEHRR